MLEMHLTCPHCKKTFVIYPLVAAVELDGFVDCCPRCHTSVGYRWLEEIQPAFLQLADIDQRMNSDKEGQRCRLKNRAGKSRSDRDKNTLKSENVVNSVVYAKKST